MKIKKVLLNIIKAGLMTIGAATVVLAGFVFWNAGIGNQAVSFKTSEATKINFEQTISSTGTMEAVGTVDVGTQASGTIAKVYVDYNSRVKKGEVLAELDKSIFNTEVKASKAALLKAKANLKQSKNNYIRDKKLFQKDHISKEDFMETETNYNQGKADVMSAEAALEKAEINLNYTIIKSPIDGTIIEKSIEEGQTVAASYSTPTMFIIAEDLSKMQIEADVDESDIGTIKTGQPVRFTVSAYPDNSFEGVVSQIRLNPETISNVVTYTVVVDADNTDHLLMPGMTATADFIVYLEENVITVPNAALTFRPDPQYIKRPDKKTGDDRPTGFAENKQPKEGEVVFVLSEEQTLRPVKIKKGKAENGVTIISEGLNEGAQVITALNTEKKEAQKGLFSMLMKGSRPSGGGRPGGRGRPF